MLDDYVCVGTRVDTFGYQIQQATLSHSTKVSSSEGSTTSRYQVEAQYNHGPAKGKGNAEKGGR